MVWMLRTSAAIPSIMCISTWQWTRKSPRRRTFFAGFDVRSVAVTGAMCRARASQTHGRGRANEIRDRASAIRAMGFGPVTL